MEQKEKSTLFKYVILPGLLILIIVIILNSFLYQLEANFFSNAYNNEIAGIINLINRKFQSVLVSAESIKAFFISSQEVTEEEFNLFGPVLTETIGSDIVFVPIAVEWIDAQNHIQYVYPMNENNDKIIGLDLNQYPNRLLPITKAKETRSSVVTEPIMLGQGYPGLLLYSPIFKGDDYLGEAVVVIRLNTLLALAPGSSLIYEKDLRIQTDNFVMPFDEDAIFNNNGERIINPQGELTKDPNAQKYFTPTINTVSHNIVFADKTWQLKLIPTYIGQITQRMIVYTGVSLIFTLSIIIFLWMLERRRKQLLLITARTEALILSIGDGLVASDKNGIITFANKKAEDLSGYNAADSIGKSYYDVWRLMNAKGMAIPIEKRHFHRALVEGEITKISIIDHLSILRKDGTSLPISSTISPIIVNGNIEGAIIVFRDATKESEIDRMKSEFLSLASHQLLTPISSTKWITETLLNKKTGPLNESQKEYIRNIQTSIRRTEELINSLLNISRIESGRLMIKPELTSLNQLAEEVIGELKNKLEEKGQKVEMKTDPNLPKINVDPKLIREIFRNFMTNAIKYSPIGKNISIETKVDGANIISSVTDNGYGISENEQHKVFEKFYRGDNILEIEKDGNGLGLYLVKQIVEASGGKVWFESVIDHGTTFWFSLPLSGSPTKAGEVSLS
jgi:PAS domain S-box-containing protein